MPYQGCVKLQGSGHASEEDNRYCDCDGNIDEAFALAPESAERQVKFQLTLHFGSHKSPLVDVKNECKAKNSLEGETEEEREAPEKEVAVTVALARGLVATAAAIT